jgi:cell wall-associated NlpC family hydrolase
MKYAICCVPVAAIRITPDHKSEMVSQLLFGEYCIITDNDKKGWIKIICKADDYEGWCQVTHVEDIASTQYKSETAALAGDWVNEIDFCGQIMHIPLGSLITEQKVLKGQVLKIWNPADAKKNEATVKQIAYKFLNTVYLWGGRSVFGIDCSGFSQAVFKFLNIALLRDAQQQATQGELVNFLQEALCGDLAFFDNEEGQIIHVGILLNDSEIIHASGKVRIDKIDNQGIVNADTGERTQKLRIIKRYF